MRATLPSPLIAADRFRRLESPRRTPTKEATKWGHSKVSAADLASYDYSSDVSSSGASTPLNPKSLLSSSALGKVSSAGHYEVADYATATPSTAAPSIFSTLFSKLSLSAKPLSATDLAPALAAMREHLMAKNVAKDIADKVCEGVGKSLEGKKVSGFGSIKTEVRNALEEALVRILTPKSSTDLLLDITRKRDARGGQEAGPYAIAFVGVNGVGKSTNLSKVAFWLLQNKMRVLIAACDTFRSGAVEQLRVHVRNLGRLGEEIGGVGLVESGVQMVELYERGYGKDAAGIAKDAIAYGESLSLGAGAWY